MAPPRRGRTGSSAPARSRSRSASPSDRFPLLSLPRFGLVVFPFFLALAALGERRQTAIVATSAALLGVVIVQWVEWQWVA